MGVVSFGRIGKAIAKRGQAFGLRVIAYDPYVEAEAMSAHDVEKADKERIVRESDYLMVQVPMTAETRHFIGEKEIMAMKPGAFIITTGRGPTVDNEALYRALAEGHIAGAGLDDLEEEPAKCKSWSPNGNALFGLENVLITPHTAYYSEESIRMARETAASEVARVLTGQRPRNPVNKVRLADATVSVSSSRIDV
jgi:D-3-phosphoglycerate dehydrogenase